MTSFNMNNLFLKLVSFVLFFQCIIFSGFAQVKVESPLAENLSNPVGLGVSNPRFSWRLVSEKRNVTQKAYEVRVSSDAQGSKIVWNSGRVESDSSVHVSYKGEALQSGKKYYWQVRVWDNSGKSSGWSSIAFFQMSLLNLSDWKAFWISSGLPEDTVNGISPLLRKTFVSPKKVQSATAFVASRGLYEVFINGKRVGDAYLTPGWTSYNHHLQFQTYDVTPLLTEGRNAIGAILGSGWYRTRLTWLNQQNFYGKETALLFQLHITYTDGTTEVIISDGSWKANDSDITYSEIYNGEMQDSRKRITNWQMSSYEDAGWPSVVVKDFPKTNLTAAINEPIRKHETFKPVRVIKTPKGDIVLDFGQNLVGWIKLTVSGKPGEKITLSHSEIMDKHGELYFENLRSAKAQAVYTLKGEGAETFEPHFTFFGFRYARIEGLSGQVHPENFTAIALYSDMQPSGTFECSNAMINQLQKNIQWGQKGNFLDVPTDCPQRDERLGWTGDAEVFSRTAAYNFNVNQFFAKWLKDVTADQEPNGAVPFVIPNVLKGGSFGGPTGAAGWSDASIIIPWNMYLVYGDRRIVERQYPTMQKYLNYMRNAAKDDLWNTGFQFADWLSYRVDDSKTMIGQKSAVTNNYLVAQCFYAFATDLMIKAAKLLNKPEDAQDYEALLTKIKAAFQKEYMTASGRLISETQTAYVLALQFDMLPGMLRAQAADRLEANIKSYDYHLTTGFLGTPFLNHVLTRFGKNEIAYKLLLQDTYPSWLFPVKMGATTIWERWDSQKTDSTFQDPGMTSFNHYAYGAVGDWMYRTIAGIDTDDQAVGYRKIRIKPYPGGGLTWASASYQSYYGTIKSYWKMENGKFLLNVEIPANTTATVLIPGENAGDITESGKTIDRSLVKGKDDGYISLTLGSGRYQFSTVINNQPAVVK